MAGKSPMELIREVQVEMARLLQRLDGFQDEVNKADLLQVRERLAVLESLVAELKKQAEEKDRRWWQFWLGVGVVVLTFAANLTINLVMFFARKSG
jgi:hypothetical protein